jgi:hypothetical protein
MAQVVKQQVKPKGNTLIERNHSFQAVYGHKRHTPEPLPTSNAEDSFPSLHHLPLHHLSIQASSPFKRPLRIRWWHHDRFLRNGTVPTPHTASLHTIRVHARGWWAHDACTSFITALEVDVLDVEGVDVTWEIAEDG